MLLRKHFLLALLLFTTKNMFAWVYPEHRQILILAIQQLNVYNRVLLDSLWNEARRGYETRLTSIVIDPGQGNKTTQLDYASWSAIAGDHSCSPENMLYNVLQTEWILQVAGIAAELNTAIENAKTKSQHLNAVRISDTRLQRADDEYATRAGSNNVHFLLARPGINTEVSSYIESCFKEGAALNALGVYAWFHKSALLKAARYAKGQLQAGEKKALALAILADEAFALHFLEDVFAAGHFAGTWGVAAVRKGTHDYYNEHGLEVSSWDGKRMIHMGDAYMRKEDAEEAATVVALSLQQLMAATNGTLVSDLHDDKPAQENRPDNFNICTNNLMPARTYDLALLKEVIVKTPVPGLATGLGELPRYRAELGTFLGLSTSATASGVSGGFGEHQSATGLQGSLEANIRVGFSLEGVLSETAAGLMFVQVGWRQDAASTNKYYNKGVPGVANSYTSAIPGRTAYNLRFRIPFWLIPGDLLLAAPVMYFTNRKALEKMAVTATNGGLIPWQAGIATRIGRVQFVLGREIGLSFYGLGSQRDAIIIPVSTDPYLLSYKSTKLEFPIVEYRPVRNFSQDQTSSIMIQLSAGVDIPHHIRTIYPDRADPPPFKSIWYIGVHLLFDWRHYF